MATTLTAATEEELAMPGVQRWIVSPSMPMLFGDDGSGVLRCPNCPGPLVMGMPPVRTPMVIECGGCGFAGFVEGSQA